METADAVAEHPDPRLADRLRRLRLANERWARKGRESFVDFCRNPGLFGEEVPQLHHELMCAMLQDVDSGRLKRLMIFMPPGSAKSTYSSDRAASWFMGRKPGRKLIAASHTKGLAERFGRKVRNRLDTAEFRAVFPGFALASDSKSKSDWGTADGGEYYAVGFDGAVAGRRADILLIDDPFKSRLDADSETIRNNVWEVYRTDLRSRLRKNGAIVIIMTRWHHDDLAGRILPEGWDGKSGHVKARDGEEWYVLRIPMIAEQDDPLGRDEGDTLWPDWFVPSVIAREKLIQGSRNWNALYQGVPTADEGAILKSSYWRRWPGKSPPVCEYIIQSIDGAFEEGEENDYSARTTWGIFDVYNVENARAISALISGPSRKGEQQRYHAILLEAWRGKVEFAAFKRIIKDGIVEYEPDLVLIEKKASGHVLLQELKRSGTHATAVNPRGSKTSRTWAAQPAFEQGAVWHMDRDWAGPVVRECSQFPAGEHDDYHDTVTQAINRLRKTYHLSLPGEGATDETEDDEEHEHGIYG